MDESVITLTDARIDLQGIPMKVIIVVLWLLSQFITMTTMAFGTLVVKLGDIAATSFGWKLSKAIWKIPNGK